MMDATVFLEHHGVKGMKWGVRHDPGHQGERAKTKKIEKLDKKFVNQSPMKAWVSIYNRAADIGNGPGGSIERVNAKWGNKFGKPGSPTYAKYERDMQNEFLKDARKAAGEFGTSASGRYSIDVTPSNGFGGFDIVMKDNQAKHSSFSPGDMVIPVKYKLDSSDKIVGFEVGEGVQHDDLFNSFLSHHGVKGMKWGVRKKTTRRTSSDFKKTAHLRGRHPAELSNKQIKTVNERVNLEQNYRRLNPNAAEKGQKHIKAIIGIVGTASTLLTLSQTPAGKTFISAGKLALQKKSTPVTTKAATSLVETLANNAGRVALQTVKK